MITVTTAPARPPLSKLVAGLTKPAIYPKNTFELNAVWAAHALKIWTTLGMRDGRQRKGNGNTTRQRWQHG